MEQVKKSTDQGIHRYNVQLVSLVGQYMPCRAVQALIISTC